MPERVVIGRGVRAAINAHERIAGDCETGGILIGRTIDTSLRVAVASPPGPRAVKRRRFFRRDTDFLQRYLDRRVRQAPDEIDYVGEWHVHRAINTEPSSLDRREMRRIAASPNYPTETPVLLLVESEPGETRLRAFRFGAKRWRRAQEVDLELD